MTSSFKSLLSALNIPVDRTVYIYGESFMVDYLLKNYEFDLDYLMVMQPTHHVLNTRQPVMESENTLHIVFSNYPAESARQIFSIESDGLFNVDWLTLTSAEPPTATQNNTPYSMT